jgi:transcriptional regulator GlxA family with amidase domain
MARNKTTVAVMMFDRAPIFEMSVPISVFGVDRSASGAPAFTLLPVAAEGGLLTSTGGLEIAAPYGLDALDRAGIVIIPSWRDPLETPPEPALQAIRAAHGDGALIVSLCMGAFVLAATGLLNGHRTATHWFHAATLAARYPLVTVDPEALYIDDGEIITSAGTAAGLDACLHLVRRLWGPKAATIIARRMVAPPHRSGGQAQYIDQSVPTHTSDDDRLSNVMAYALSHLDADLDITALAAQAHQSRRTFDRRFRAMTGGSPLQWLLHQRVLRAQRLLEDSDMPIDAIARQVGLANAISLRPHFRRTVGVSPQQYRDTFRTRIGSNRGSTRESVGGRRPTGRSSSPDPPAAVIPAGHEHRVPCQNASRSAPRA